MEIQVCNNNKAWDYRGAENRDFLSHFRSFFKHVGWRYEEKLGNVFERKFTQDSENGIGFFIACAVLSISG